jgi:cytochrome c oxidase subunit IV
MSDPHAVPTTTPSTTDAKNDVLGDVDQPATLLLVFAAVIGLSLANVGLSVTGLGKYALVVQLLIGTIQAGLVSYYFMHLRHGDRVVILTALASIFWMGILFVLFMADYMTRQWVIGN